MTALPPFPVDPGTLDAIEEALNTAVPDERACATRESAAAPHGTQLPITAGEVDAHPNLDDLLEHLSGYVEEAGVEGEPQSGIVMHSIPTVYNRDDVILALITEVRQLRDVAGTRIKSPFAERGNNIRADETGEQP